MRFIFKVLYFKFVAKDFLKLLEIEKGIKFDFLNSDLILNNCPEVSLNQIKNKLLSQSIKMKNGICEIHSLPGLLKAVTSNVFLADLEKFQSILFV